MDNCFKGFLYHLLVHPERSYRFIFVSYFLQNEILIMLLKPETVQQKKSIPLQLWLNQINID